MRVNQYSQIKNEYISWQRRLEFSRQENTLLKFRLSDMVDHNEQNHFLAIAECFQNELLLKDDTLRKLIKRVSDLEAEINKMPEAGSISQRWFSRYEKLRNDIWQFEKCFLNLTYEFNEKMVLNS